MLSAVCLYPERELSIAELAAIADTTPTNALREVDRFVESGYFLERRVGRSRLIRTNESHPLVVPLTHILRYTYGVIPALERLLAASPITGLQRAVLYGSWADRFSGVAGREPQDVDVLIVGEADRGQVYDLARRATDELGREVNMTLVSHERWTHGRDGFMETVRSRPMVELHIDGRLG